MSLMKGVIAVIGRHKADKEQNDASGATKRRTSHDDRLYGCRAPEWITAVSFALQDRQCSDKLPLGCQLQGESRASAKICPQQFQRFMTIHRVPRQDARRKILCFMS